jgi:hypothetical protein
MYRECLFLFNAAPATAAPVPPCPLCPASLWPGWLHLRDVQLSEETSTAGIARCLLLLRTTSAFQLLSWFATTAGGDRGRLKYAAIGSSEMPAVARRHTNRLLDVKQSSSRCRAASVTGAMRSRILQTYQLDRHMSSLSHPRLDKPRRRGCVREAALEAGQPAG